MLVAIDSKTKLSLIASLALDKKAEDLRVLDMREIGNFCDYFVIFSGNSLRQVKAIAAGIRQGLDMENIGPRSLEGADDSGWILLDCLDIVVHIFHSPVREFYGLERLWQDAPRVRLRIGMKKDVRKAGRRKSQ